MEWLFGMTGAVDFIFLVIASFFTSFLSAAMGIGGGTALLAVMAQIMPAAAIVPVHGVVQLGSNAGRMWLFREHLNRPLFKYFMAGAVVGAFVGGQIVVALPIQTIQLILGLFILYSTWAPKFTIAHRNITTGRFAIGGGFATLLTMFVGATGPFVMTLIKPFHLGKMAQVGTFSTCMVFQHALKVIVFGVLGFAFGPYLPLMVAMVACGFLGTLTGKHFLEKTSERLFRILLNIILTALALRLLWTALM